MMLAATPEWFKAFDHFMYYRFSFVMLGFLLFVFGWAAYRLWNDEH